jgi:hypothetical protein
MALLYLPLLLALVISVALLFLYHSADVFEKASGAFMGAFFAFFFVRLAEVMKALYDRQARNQIALVRIQHIFNGYLEDFHTDLFEIGEIETHALKFTQQGMPLSFNRLLPFSVHKDVLLDLTNIDFVNDLFSFNVLLERANNSIEKLSDVGKTMRALALTENPAFNYEEQFKSYAKSTGELKPYIDRLNDRALEVLGKARVLSSRGSLFLRSRLFEFLISAHYSRRDIRRFAVEKEAIMNEIRTINKLQPTTVQRGNARE